MMRADAKAVHVFADRLVLKHSADGQWLPRLRHQRHVKLISKQRSILAPATVVALQPSKRRTAHPAVKRDHLSQGKAEQIGSLAVLNIRCRVADYGLRKKKRRMRCQ